MLNILLEENNDQSNQGTYTKPVFKEQKPVYNSIQMETS